jgi:hypothetical protein
VALSFQKALFLVAHHNILVAPYNLQADALAKTLIAQYILGIEGVRSPTGEVTVTLECSGCHIAALIGLYQNTMRYF